MGFFLTYPQCSLTPHEALELLKNCCDTPIKEYVIATEAHKDGQPHLHAFLRYERKVTWRANLWDIAGHHGNYQQSKSREAVIKYCTKEGNFIANIDVQSAKMKKACRNKELIDEDAKKLVDDGTIGLLQLPSLVKAKAAYFLAQPPFRADDVRGFWVVGPSGSGKTHLARTKAETYFLKAQNKWWDGYEGQHHVILDDFDEQGLCLAHYLKIWADKWECTGEIKGGTVSLMHRFFWITSQYEIGDLWNLPEQQEIRDALRRRFRIIRMRDRAVVSTKDVQLPNN